MKSGLLIQMQRSSILLVLTTLAVALASAIPANATFSGKNGRIVFAQGKPPDIYTMNPNGSEIKQLTFFGSNGGSAAWANWSPDGAELAFSQQASTTAPAQLWIMNFDGNNQHMLLNDPSYSDVVPSFSPDGTKIVFTRCIGGTFRCAIYRINADGSELTAITHFNSNPDILDYDPAYSPDGSTIAFESLSRGGWLEAIYLMDADGSNIHSITPPRLGAEEANWSPDGTTILFSSNDPGCGGGSCFVFSPEIWLISADESEITRLTFNNKQWHGINTVPHDFAPSWSPEGDAIVFERDSPDFSKSAIYVMNRDGSNQKLILEVSTNRALILPLRNRVAETRLATPHLPKLIEQGGFFPRWGAARGGVK
jgi:Tol biopolymer transport system component